MGQFQVGILSPGKPERILYQAGFNLSKKISRQYLLRDVFQGIHLHGCKFQSFKFKVYQTQTLPNTE